MTHMFQLAMMEFLRDVEWRVVDIVLGEIPEEEVFYFEHFAVTFEAYRISHDPRSEE